MNIAERNTEIAKFISRIMREASAEGEVPAYVALDAFVTCVSQELSDIDRDVRSGHVRMQLANAYEALMVARGHVKTACEAYKKDPLPPCSKCGRTGHAAQDHAWDASLNKEGA